MGIFSFLNPENAVESSGQGVQEGLARVDESVYAVIAPQAREGQETRKPHMAMVWRCTKLDEDTQEPMLDADGGEEKLELTFSMGGSSLTDRDGKPQLHPGMASGPVKDFDEVEDLGDEPGTEGPTLAVLNREYQINRQSGIEYLFASLQDGLSPKKDSKVRDKFSGCGVPKEIINSGWAPAYNGLVFHFRTLTSEFQMGGRGIPYKIVDKIISAPWEKKGKAAAGAGKAAAGVAVPKAPPAKAKATKAGSAETTNAGSLEPWQKVKVVTEQNGAASDPSGIVFGIIEKMSGEMAGETVTGKAFRQQVSRAVQQTAGANNLVPCMELLTTAKWLEGQAAALDLVVEEQEGKIGSVSFN